MKKLLVSLKKTLSAPIYIAFSVDSVLRGIVTGLVAVIFYLAVLTVAAMFLSFNSQHLPNDFWIIGIGLLSYLWLIFVTIILKGNIIISGLMLLAIIIFSFIDSYMVVTFTYCYALVLQGGKCI